MTTLNIRGEQYVLVSAKAYDRLVARAEDRPVPPLPEADEKGRRPALATVRAAMARNIIRRRMAAGWSPQELARRAKTRPATISRIESGTHRVQRDVIRRIDHALKAANV
jgi:ribosome-binding protein aMBF1 (putative translation factor)